MDYLLCGKRCDMKNKGSPKTIRRSVALREFANQQRARAFEEAMGQMAVDPAIRSECAAISREFSITEADGLPVGATADRA